MVRLPSSGCALSLHKPSASSKWCFCGRGFAVGQQGNQAWFWVPVDPDGDEDVLGAAKKQLVFDPTGFVHGYATTAQFEYVTWPWQRMSNFACP